MTIQAPIATTWEIGKDTHGRRVLLHKRNGQFDLVSEPVNQRDDGEKLFSLTLENLRAIGELAASLKA